jgi:hypothetical protein
VQIVGIITYITGASTEPLPLRPNVSMKSRRLREHVKYAAFSIGPFGRPFKYAPKRCGLFAGKARRHQKVSARRVAEGAHRGKSAKTKNYNITAIPRYARDERRAVLRPLACLRQRASKDVHATTRAAMWNAYPPALGPVLRPPYA